MDTELAQFTLDGGRAVLVEVEEQAAVQRIARDGKSLQRASASFNEALQDVRAAAETVVDQFRSLQHRPDTVEVSFGVKLDAQVGAVIAHGGVEANFQVTLSWTNS